MLLSGVATEEKNNLLSMTRSNEFEFKYFKVDDNFFSNSKESNTCNKWSGEIMESTSSDAIKNRLERHLKRMM